MRFRQVHLDFHTSEKIDKIGSKFDPDQFKAALKAGHVNSITLFAKCHHGWMYYPSIMFEMHPGLDFDLLGAQLEAAHSISVDTPVYLSAGFDEKIAVSHPEWVYDDKSHSHAAPDTYNKAGYHIMCMNTPYLDYLLDQVREVCERYESINAIFLDIVEVRPCYCRSCMKSLMQRGKNPNDDDAVMELAEHVYANYVKRVRETLDSIRPGIRVFHNGGHIRHGRRDLAFANTHLELESLPTGGWGYDHFPVSAAYVRDLGMDYLGMTGKFHTTWGEFGGFKHPNALRYEMSLNIANGAKCSIGDQLAPDGHMDPATYELIGYAYSEVEQKEEWVDNVESVADIALFSNEAYINIMGGYTKETINDAGVARILLEGKYLFDIVDLESDFLKYKIIILADNILLIPQLSDKLDEFVKHGGKILATGISGLKQDNSFRYDLGAKFVDESGYKPSYMHPMFTYDDVSDTDYVMYSDGYIAECTGEMLAEAVKPYFNRTREHFCSHFHAPASGERIGCGMSMGSDGIYIAWKVFEDYALKGSLILKRMVCFALDALLNDEKTLKTSLPQQGVSTLMRQNDRFILHLLYAVPTKRGENVEVIEDIVPIYNVDVSLKLGADIKNVYLAPQRTPIPFKLKDGRIDLTVPELLCHQMVVFKT